MSAPLEASAWLEAELANLRAAAIWAADTGYPRHAVEIPAAIHGFLEARGYVEQDRGLYQVAVTACRQAGYRTGQAQALALLSVVQGMMSDYRAAAETMNQALEIYRELGHQAGQGQALAGLGVLRMTAADYPGAPPTTSARRLICCGRPATGPPRPAR
ncbi:MAG: hypothetical protein ABJB47_16250 [Actinomycetota bacterium]